MKSLDQSAKEALKSLDLACELLQKSMLAKRESIYPQERPQGTPKEYKVFWKNPAIGIQSGVYSLHDNAGNKFKDFTHADRHAQELINKGHATEAHIFSGDNDFSPVKSYK